MLSLGDGIVAGVGIVTIAVSLFKLRSTRKSNDVDDLTTAVATQLNGKYVVKDVCAIQHAETNRRLISLETKVDRLLEIMMVK